MRTKADFTVLLQFSVVQLPLSIMALGVYIKASSCTPWGKSHEAAPPQPFCSAPIVLAATIVLIEVTTGHGHLLHLPA